MSITKTVAKSAVGMLDMFTTPAQAAHQCRVQLTAIRPYTDRALSAVETVLDLVARQSDERQAVLISQLRTIAAR